MTEDLAALLRATGGPDLEPSSVSAESVRLAVDVEDLAHQLGPGPWSFDAWWGAFGRHRSPAGWARLEAIVERLREVEGDGIETAERLRRWLKPQRRSAGKRRWQRLKDRLAGQGYAARLVAPEGETVPRLLQLDPRDLVRARWLLDLRDEDAERAAEAALDRWTLFDLTA